MNKYKKDKNYFLNYFKLNVLIFSLFNAILLFIRNDYLFELNLFNLALIPAGLIFGLVVATVFHNASHGNVGPRLLNTLVGEFCGVVALDGMRNFRVGHMLHHIHSSNPEMDPHPPHGLSFCEFIKTSKDRTIKILIDVYYKYHSDSKESVKNIESQIFYYKISFVLKVLFWFLLLGPVGFVFFYIPTFSSYFFGFAHLNYISHSLDEDGNEVMYNHDGGVFYTVMNFLTSGGYYHKNHHKYPGLYNPKRLDRLSSRSAGQEIVLN